MMCKHKVLAVCKVILPDSMEIKRAFCVHCGKTKTEIDIEQQLAAANAELAELKKQNAELFPYYQDHCEGALIPATEYQQWIKRAEQAEAQCAAMQAVIEYLSMRYRLCVQILPNGAWQVENQKRATEFAALEEKP